MDGWMDGWMDRWMDKLDHTLKLAALNFGPWLIEWGLY